MLSSRSSWLLAGCISLAAMPAAGGAGEQAEPEPRLPLPPYVEELIIEREVRPRGRRAYLFLLTREAEARGLPPAVADAVAAVESGYQPGAVGAVGEVGIMQVRPTTAAMLGHRGSLAELFVPETNIRFGVAYLAKAWQLAGGDLCRALMKYRAGHGEERMTALSVDYCRRARVHLASLGSPFGNAVLPAAASPISTARLSPAVASTKAPVNPVVAPSSADLAKARALRETQRLWAEHVERIRRIEMNIGRIMGTTSRS